MTLEAFFSPRNIALAGASRREGKMGNLFMRHLLDGFSGKIFPVHPAGKEILGVPAYPDIGAIPEPVDLLIPLIPSEQLLPLVESCARGRVKHLLAIPSGFGEIPSGGKARERELVRLARERGIRVIGPNCLGMFNCIEGLNASMAPAIPGGGAGFSCITQSGGFGMAISMYTRDHQLRMAKFCDLGNTADVTVQEILRYFRDDPDTRIIGLYLESIRDWPAFLADATQSAATKPVIFTKLGRTGAGKRASFAHLGISSDDERLAPHEGSHKIIQARTGLEMLHIAKGLSRQPLPAGRRAAVLTGSGGVGAELVDLCVEHGLEVPEFSTRLQNELRPVLPSYAGVQNPVDLTPIWWDFYKVYPPLIRTLLASREVDLVLVTVLDVATTLPPLMHAIAETATRYLGETASPKPIYLYWASSQEAWANMRILEEAHVPCYTSTFDTVRVAAAISRYASQLSK